MNKSCEISGPAGCIAAGLLAARAVGLFLLLCLLFSIGGHVRAASVGAFTPLHDPAIAVRDPANAYLIGVARAGRRLVAVGGHGVIIYSDDNGSRWSQAAVPVSVTITSLAFPSPQEGWAAGAYGVVLHTRDAGATWETQITGIDVNRLMTGAAAQVQRDKPDDPATIRATRRAGIFAGSGPDKPFLSVLALSRTDVMVVGGYRMCVRTADSGRSWSDCSLRVPDPVSHNLYDAAQVDGVMYLVGEAGSVFRSPDLGATFEALASPGDATLFGILGIRPDKLLAFGVADAMFASADGGRSWTASAVSSGSEFTGGIKLSDGAIVVTCENGAIYRSLDDGRSFEMLPASLGMAAFGLTQAVNGDLVVVGAGGVRIISSSAMNHSG